MSELVAVYRHNAPEPDRYYYDTYIHNNSGWSEGRTAFYAYTSEQSGTIPIYRHNAKDPDRYYYDTNLHNNSGWSEGVVAFYAYPTEQAGTIPIYRHQAPSPDRYYYDINLHNGSGWSEGVVAFYAYPPGWMAQIPDNALLSQISFPATHESMSRYEYGCDCHDATLTEQLEKGVRVFDIRLRYLKGSNGDVNFSVHHGNAYQNAFFDSKFPHDDDCKIFVLDQCLAFLADNPTEVVVLLIKQEKDAQKRADFFDAFWKIIDNRDPSNGASNKLFYTGNVVPRLGNHVRGKIVFAFVDGDDGNDYKLSAPRWGLYWGNIDYEVDWNDLQPGQQPNLDVENHWKDLMDYKWDKIDAHLKKTLAMGPGSVIWCSTFTSASRVPDLGYFPKDYADYLLPKVYAEIAGYVESPPKNWPWGTYFGSVFMDFESMDIITLLINAARRYQYPT